MRVIIKPSVPSGRIQAPPSKSYAHRLILCAALAEGKSIIRNISLSDDICATIDCARALGAKTEYENGTLTVYGLGGRFNGISEPLQCRECGSTIRFFIPVCMLSGQHVVLQGSETLLKRPMQVYEEICRSQGIGYVQTSDAIAVDGKLQPGTFTFPGNISSQFVSGLLFALPLLERESKICLSGKVESKPYIDITLKVLSAFGVQAYWVNDNTLFIEGNQTYKPVDAENEGDWSNAAFMLALRQCGASVEVDGINADSVQGDKVCMQYFARLNQEYTFCDISDCPDLAPILFSFAAMHHGGTFTGTKRLAIKESDRGAAMAEELAKFGVRVEHEEDRIVIPPSCVHAPDAVLFGHNDHRIVMSLAVLCIKYGGVIDGAEAVNKSYPGFFEDLKKLKVKVEYEAG